MLPQQGRNERKIRVPTVAEFMHSLMYEANIDVGMYLARPDV
jgi:hypothetical protein